MEEIRMATETITRPGLKHETLAAALAAFQAELPKLRKDETAKVTGENAKTGAKVSYSYGYAGLDTVVDTVLPVLGKHGLSITSKSTFIDGSFMLEVSLLHESGERETGYWPLPDPRRVGPQDLGSAYTYGRRYLTLALTGTFPGGEDDDGAKAQQAPRDSWDSARPARPTQAVDRQQQAGEEPQAAPARQAPKTVWSDTEVQELQTKLADRTVSLAVTGKGYDWMASKGLHDRPVGKSGVTGTLVLALRLADTVLTPETGLDEIAEIRAFAHDRGLLKVKVSATETLEEVVHEARELAAHAIVEQAKADTPNPQDEG
jgi:hypothetical protein